MQLYTTRMNVQGFLQDLPWNAHNTNDVLEANSYPVLIYPDRQQQQWLGGDYIPLERLLQFYLIAHRRGKKLELLDYVTELQLLP